MAFFPVDADAPALVFRLFRQLGNGAYVLDLKGINGGNGECVADLEVVQFQRGVEVFEQPLRTVETFG